MTALKRFKHLKKGCMIPLGFANVGVGYNDHVAGSISGSLGKPPLGFAFIMRRQKAWAIIVREQLSTALGFKSNRYNKLNRVTMQALKDYQKLIAEVDRRCRRIRTRHQNHIACTKGCAGNCCRIHISIYPVEAVSLALSLQKLAPEMRHRIQHNARHANTFGPCPLLEGGACLIYHARAVICRTHGLPMLTEYRGHRAVGFCEKNFQHLSPIPEEDIIDLAHLNNSLAAANRRFVSEVGQRLLPGDRFTIAQALLLDLLVA